MILFPNSSGRTWAPDGPAGIGAVEPLHSPVVAPAHHFFEPGLTCAGGAAHGAVSVSDRIGVQAGGPVGEGKRKELDEAEASLGDDHVLEAAQ